MAPTARCGPRADAPPAAPAAAPVRGAPLLLGGLAAASAATHGAAAAGAGGAMAWSMAAMGLLCLGCMVHLRPGGHGVRAAAVHLMFMCAAMVMVHVGWLSLQAPGHHGRTGPGGPPDTGHVGTMLAPVAVELVCLAAAAAVLRQLRRRSAVVY